MKIESRVAGAPRYVGSSTRATATTLPSAGAITNRSPRGPERTGSRKNTISHKARSSSTTSSAQSHRPHVPALHAPIATRAHPGRMKGQPSGAIRISAPQGRVPSGGGTHRGSARSWRAPHRVGAAAAAGSRSTSPASSGRPDSRATRSEEHTSELQSRPHLVCRLLLEKKKKKTLNISLSSDELTHYPNPVPSYTQHRCMLNKCHLGCN